MVAASLPARTAPAMAAPLRESATVTRMWRTTMRASSRRSLAACGRNSRPALPSQGARAGAARRAALMMAASLPTRTAAAIESGMAFPHRLHGHPARLPAVRPPYASRSSAAGRGDGPLRAGAGVWGRLARTEQRALAERSFRRCTTSGATARVTACVDYGGHGVGHAFAVAGAANRRTGRGVTGGCGRVDAEVRGPAGGSGQRGAIVARSDTPTSSTTPAVVSWALAWLQAGRKGRAAAFIEHRRRGTRPRVVEYHHPHVHYSQAGGGVDRQPPAGARVGSRHPAREEREVHQRAYGELAIPEAGPGAAETLRISQR